MKKSEKILRNRIITIDELQKDLNNVSDTFQVHIGFKLKVLGSAVLNRLVCYLFMCLCNLYYCIHYI